jgi:uncharacterized protein YcgI (DUF1989 family)
VASELEHARGEAAPLALDVGFYADLIRDRATFELASNHIVPRGTGYGFRVEAGQTFRFRVLERAQILDVNMMNADDPREHFSTGTQLTLEGGRITRLTRIWGTPPRSRPLATCIADTVRTQPNERLLRDHFGYSGHCSAHFWLLFTGSHHRPCYDNLRAGAAMLGLSQRWIHSSMNLFMKAAFDSAGVKHLDRSDAVAGDYLEFFAEIPLHVVMSLCPNGSGLSPNEIWDDALATPVYPVGVEISTTGRSPLQVDPVDQPRAHRHINGGRQ